MPEDRIDVLYLTTSMGRGGADKQISLLSRELNEKNGRVRIVSLRPLGAMGEELVDSPIDITSLEIEDDRELAYKLPALLYRIARDQPDIIHGHMYHSNVLSRVVSTFFPGVSSISTVHSTYETRDSNLPKVTLRERMYRATDVLSDLTTFVSEASRQRYISVKAVAEDKSVVIYNGIDTQEFQRYPERGSAIRERHGANDEFVWLAVGRFAHAKDYPTMIRAFSQLSKANSELWILGEGELKGAIEQEIEDNDVTGRVKLLGTTDDVASYMSAADGFALSSQWEGFGLVVAEAMACELPVVSTRSGGPAEIVVDGETGYLCDVKSPNELSEKMLRMMELGAQEREGMGKKGRERVRNRFDIEEIARTWIREYKRVI